MTNAKGTAFETQIARALSAALGDEGIERRSRNGTKDRGDITGLRIHGKRLVIECKNTTRTALPEWINEAQTEAGNDDALCGVVIAKRKGKTDPMAQWVHCTVAELIALITGQRTTQ